MGMRIRTTFPLLLLAVLAGCETTYVVTREALWESVLVAFLLVALVGLFLARRRYR
jgi:uncharacterized membrane protein